MSKEDSGQMPLLNEIYREVGEAKIKLDDVVKRFDNHVELTREELRNIHELDAEQNRILDKHVEGVNTLKEMYVAHREEAKEQIKLLKASLKLQKEELKVKINESNKRIEALEKPYDFVKYFGKVLAWSIPIIGTAIGIYFKFLA